VEFGAVVVVAAIDDGVVDPASVELVVDAEHLAERLGHDRTGRDGVHADAAFGELERERLAVELVDELRERLVDRAVLPGQSRLDQLDTGLAVQRGDPTDELGPCPERDATDRHHRRLG